MQEEWLESMLRWWFKWMLSEEEMDKLDELADMELWDFDKEKEELNPDDYTTKDILEWLKRTADINIEYSKYFAPSYIEWRIEEVIYEYITGSWDDEDIENMCESFVKFFKPSIVDGIADKYWLEEYEKELLNNWVWFAYWVLSKDKESLWNIWNESEMYKLYKNINNKVLFRDMMAITSWVEVGTKTRSIKEYKELMNKVSKDIVVSNWFSVANS